MKRRLVVILFVVLFPVISYAEPYMIDTEYRIENQKSKEWCVAYAVCSAVEYQMRQAGLEVAENGFSKVWLYTKCKEIDNSDDDGTYLWIALKIATDIGLCPEDLCPTNEYLYKKNLPELTEEMEEEAGKYKIEGYSPVPILAGSVANELANDKYVIITTEVHRKHWMDDLTKIPKTKAKGYHSSYLVGYDDDTKELIGVNSMGKSWRGKGMYKMAYDYFNFGVIREVWVVKIKEPSADKDTSCNSHPETT